MSDSKIANNRVEILAKANRRLMDEKAALVEERDRARRIAVSLEQENAEMQQTIHRLRSRIAYPEAGGEDRG